MKVLLDECLPAKLKKYLRGHKVETASGLGWSGKKNGELLGLAASEFDVFITVDRNLAFQQNRSNLPIPVVVLYGHSNRFEELLPLIDKVLDLLGGVLEKRVYEVH